MPAMSARLQWSLVLCVVATCSASVLIFSGEGPMAGAVELDGYGRWAFPLRAVASLCTIPIATRDIADIRDIVPLVGLAVVLIVLAFARRPTGDAANPKPPFAANLALRWLVVTGAMALFIGLLSAAANQTWALSWGWIVRTAVGLGWAGVIALRFDGRMVRRALVGLLAVGVVCMVLAVLHRADRHLNHFIWPIGPVTPTATMAALWAILAAGLAVGAEWNRRSAGSIASCVATCCVGLYVLIDTARRGPALALIAAIALIAAHWLWRTNERRAVRIAILASMAVGIAGGAFYVMRQLGDADRVASGAVGLRFEYWRLSAGMMLENVSLGSGPDTFIARMTDAVAPLRGVSPHVYHGNIDDAAHNEWIQAAVELGLPGAIFWLMMPLGVVYLAWQPARLPPDSGDGRLLRRRHVFGPAGRRPISLALGAGILLIVIAECSGVLLRGPILPIWLWTLMGLLCAAVRPTDSLFADVAAPLKRSPSAAQHDEPRTGGPLKIAMLIAAAALLVVAYMDLSAAHPDAPQRMIRDGAIDRRLYPNATITLWGAAADAASRRAELERTEPSFRAAVERQRMLYETIPGWGDTCARYAKSLLAAGESDEARRVLDEALRRHLNAFEPSANLLFARTFADDPREKTYCILRALRHAAVTDAADVLESVVGNDEVADMIESARPDALKTALAMQPLEWDDASGETLRIHAYLELRAGRIANALVSQRAAAALYAYLEGHNSPYRRGHAAETDAWLTLAVMLHDADPGNVDEAYRAIIAAERFAVLGIRHEKVADPDPSLGFVGGEVVPTEFPERLYPLWRLSALLHVKAGNEALLDGRILSYLPRERWSGEAVAREKQVIRETALRDLSKLPSSARPPHYERLRQSIAPQPEPRKD